MYSSRFFIAPGLGLLCGSAMIAGCGGDLSSIAPGSMTASQSCNLSVAGVVTVPATRCWQLTYRTTDTSGVAVETLATVLVPEGAPVSGRVLVSYQTAEDSLSPAFAPSVEFTQGLSFDSAEEANVVLDLLAGWVVVASDYEGPQSQYGAGIMAGQAVLDGIRAAENFGPAGLEGAATKVGLEGYSGGALATGWAMELQSSYAPELNIVGVAEGGIPADLTAVAKNIDGGLLAGIELLAFIGVKRAYEYQFDFERYLNAAGRAMEQNIGDMCLSSIDPATNPVAAYPFAKLDQFTTVPDFIDYAPVAAVFDQIKMGQQQHKPLAPSVFMFHSVFDELIPIGSVDALHQSYCNEGVNVLYERSLAGDHLAAAVPFFLQALPYLQSVFSGTTPTILFAPACN